MTKEMPIQSLIDRMAEMIRQKIITGVPLPEIDLSEVSLSSQLNILRYIA